MRYRCRQVVVRSCQVPASGRGSGTSWVRCDEPGPDILFSSVTQLEPRAKCPLSCDRPKMTDSRGTSRKVEPVVCHIVACGFCDQRTEDGGLCEVWMVDALANETNYTRMGIGATAIVATGGSRERQLEDLPHSLSTLNMFKTVAGTWTDTRVGPQFATRRHQGEYRSWQGPRAFWHAPR